MEHQETPQPDQVPQPLTGKEVGDYSKNVAKDVAKTTLVWTLAGTLTTLIRDLCKYLANMANKPRA